MGTIRERNRYREQSLFYPSFRKQIDVYRQEGFPDDVYEEEIYNSVDSVSYMSESCSDVVGNIKGENPFSLTRFKVLPATWSFDSTQLREVPGGYEHATFHRLVSYDGNPLEGGFSAKSDEEWVTEACSNTNPSKATAVDVPVAIAELRDLPSLFKNAAGTMHKFGANEYLKFQYGWKPLVKDIQGFLNYASKLDAKMRILSRLKDAGKVRHAYNPDSEFFSVQDQSSEYAGTAIPAGYSTMVQSYNTRITTKVIVEWTTGQVGGLPLADEEMLKLAKRAAFGGTQDGNTLWQIMPWSWLIDWTTNMSEYLGSQRYIIPVKIGNTIFMQEKFTQGTFSHHMEPRLLNFEIPGVLKYSEEILLNESNPGSSEFRSLRRVIGIDPIAMNTGELSLFGKDPFRQSILGALALQRIKRLPR